MDKNDKLIMVRSSKASSNNSFRVRVRANAYKIVQELAVETGKSITDITTELIEFAAKRVVLVDEE